MLSKVEPAFFDPGFWRERRAVVGQATGRGTTYFVRDGNRVYALRHYRRGGMLANWVSDRYIWTGLVSTRPWREWHLLKWMFDAGLPVPRPLAARVVCQLGSYTADLMTLLLSDCRSLAEMLGEADLSPVFWSQIGSVVRDFHDQGIDHADLNAHNILLNEGEKGQGVNKVYLIDFDKGRRRLGSEDWKKGNLARLHRSLMKLAGKGSHPAFTISGWKAFRQGYDRLRQDSIG